MEFMMSSMSYRGRENSSQTRITRQLTRHIRRHPESDPDIPHRASGSGGWLGKMIAGVCLAVCRRGPTRVRFQISRAADRPSRIVHEPIATRQPMGCRCRTAGEHGVSRGDTDDEMLGTAASGMILPV